MKPLPMAIIKSHQSSIAQLEYLCYVLAYYKYLLDRSVVVFAHVAITLMLVKLIRQMNKLNETASTNLQFKLFRVFQLALLSQIAVTAIFYYFNIQGQFVTHLIEEEPKSAPVKYTLLILLNISILMLQMIMATFSLTVEAKDLLQFRRFGVLIPLIPANLCHMPRDNEEINLASDEL